MVIMQYVDRYCDFTIIGEWKILQSMLVTGVAVFVGDKVHIIILHLNTVANIIVTIYFR